MKRIILYLIIFALPLVSCEKYLEVDPTNVVTLTTYDDVKALMGSYIHSFTTTGSNLSGVPIPYRTYNNHLFFAFYGDELDTDYFLNNAFARNNTSFYRESLNWMNKTFPGTLWSDYFLAIGFLNTIIDALDDVSGGTPAEKDIVRCEAKVLRAWYLFKLQQYFSPYKLNELGIPFNFDSGNIGDYDRGRKPQTAIYKTIIEELREVINCTTSPRATYNIWYDKNIAHAILAQVYHFKGESGAAAADDYEHAITHAKAAMEGHSIMTIDNYQAFYSMPANSTEYGIFKDKQQALIVSLTYSSSGMYSGINVPTTGAPFNPQFAREDVYTLFDDSDVRKSKYFVMRNNSMLGNNRQSPAIKKYQVASLNSAGVADGGSRKMLIFNFFPISDLHLIVAESYARQNDMPNAKLWLENFQKQRYQGYTSFNGNDILAEILLERRREFFLETDYRWCDLIRKNETWERNSDGSDPNVTKYSINGGDYRYCLPIPLTEEMANNKIEQNPEWDM